MQDFNYQNQGVYPEDADGYCESCGAAVSKRAPNCPRCGARQAPQPSKVATIIIVVISLVLSALAAYANVFLVEKADFEVEINPESKSSGQFGGNNGGGQFGGWEDFVTPDENPRLPVETPWGNDSSSQAGGLEGWGIPRDEPSQNQPTQPERPTQPPRDEGTPSNGMSPPGVYYVGDSVRHDYLEVKYMERDGNYTRLTPDNTVWDEDVVVLARFRITNISDEAQYIGDSEFNCDVVGGFGYRCRDILETDKLEFTELQPGESVTVSVAFAVPRDNSQVYVVYTPTISYIDFDDADAYRFSVR